MMMSETIAPKRYKIFANLFIKLLSLKLLCFYDISFVFCSLLVIRANMLAIIDKIEPVKIAKTKVVMTKPFDILPELVLPNATKFKTTPGIDRSINITNIDVITNLT